ncbi:lipase [Colletotrichum higginsianum]|uniref:Lipase n=2 Tax=Colletotrichum higginsianum TaxID=80884 RepID=H1VMY0_COLHI|nr:Lipase [Colletotrichum higginsianum IMI 349063]OBR15798.1 Lipase [Colletotrichum higginsianum IMI 349063]TID04192.1 Lipase A [Colletotrichum higginsianum]CCF41584.1 lipase [Colletotrichum higginsianum]
MFLLMRPFLHLLQLAPLVGLAFAASSGNKQQPLLPNNDNKTDGPSPIVSVELFRNLERTSRIVDIAYCVGTSGISQPFSCVSRCKEFPSFILVSTWNTGVLLSDSCGYIAVDHGVRRPGDEDRFNGDVGEKAIIVAFRGTYSISNTIIDLSTIPQEYVPYPAPDDGGEAPEEPKHKCKDCTVHMGFLASWRQARKLVIPEVAKLREQYPDYPIHLVGHSLGGAVAMLASLELKVSLGWNNILVTTFGEPKVGNQGLCDYVDEVFGLDNEEYKTFAKRSYRRVTHADDPVPLLPLTEWGYKPHAGEYYITKTELSPSLEDVIVCRGDNDARCITKGDGGFFETNVQHTAVDEVAGSMDRVGESKWTDGLPGFPARLKLWQLLFAHRDYFWRLGLCVPGGDPANWGRDKYGGREGVIADEL